MHYMIKVESLRVYCCTHLSCFHTEVVTITDLPPTSRSLFTGHLLPSIAANERLDAEHTLLMKIEASISEGFPCPSMGGSPGELNEELVT